MEMQDKLYIKAKFGLCVQRIIEANKTKAQENKLNNNNNHKLITSLRKLAASSGIEFSIIQKIASGKRNPELTTIVCLADGLGISETNLFAYYSIVSDSDVKSFLNKEKKKRNLKENKIQNKKG